MSRRGNGEGSIRQRAGGDWEARVTLGHGPKGQIRKSFYGATRNEVAEQLARALRDRQQGLPPTNDRQTVDHYLARWLEECHRLKVRPSTYKRSAQIIKQHIVPDLGRLRLAKLTPLDVQEVLNAKLASGLSPKSVRNIHQVLRSALGQAVRWGDLQRNVATLVTLPRSPHKEISPFTPEEAQAFLKAIKGDRLEALYSVVLALGLRRGEALGLLWSDVDLDGKTLTVRHALQRQDGQLQLVDVKSARSRRTVALPAFAVTVLREHRVRQLEERLVAGRDWRESGHVFTTTIGTPPDPDNVSRYFKRAVANAGLRKQRFHDLRHCCASLLLAQGVHPRVVMEILGHSHISVTMNTYSHVTADVQREAVDRLDALLTEDASAAHQ